MSQPTNTTSAFTIIEIIVSMAIFAVIVSIAMTLLMGNLANNRRVSNKADAIRIAESTLEGYRQINSYASLQTSGSPNIINSTVTQNSIPYSVKTTICPTDTPTNLPCTPNAIYLRVEVSYNNVVLQKTETYFSRFGAANA